MTSQEVTSCNQMVSFVEVTINGISHKMGVLGEEQFQLHIVFLAQFQFFLLTRSGSYRARRVKVT